MAKQTETKTITFIEDVLVNDHNGDVEFERSIGDVCALHPASADRWIRRGAAVEGEAVTNDAETEALKKAKSELEKAQERLVKAEADESNPKELELAQKFLERKQKAYYDIVGEPKAEDED